jgi:hypothetical protein
MKKSLKIILILVGVILVFGLFFRLFCGIFVIQPIGAIPQGTTIVYWRAGLDLPFIASPDGILEKTGKGVSLLGRGIVLAELSPVIIDRQIIRLGYSKVLYNISTGGVEYNN